MSSFVLLAPLYATTIVPQTHNGVTVWTGAVDTGLDASEIGAIVGVPGLESFYRAGFGNARLATNDGVGDAALAKQVIFTAVQPGMAGHGITVALVDPGVPDSPLSVSVVGTHIGISLATNAAGAPSSTASQIVGAVNATPAASTLVVATTGGAGGGIVDPLSMTTLSPVIQEAGSFASSYQTTFLNDPSFPEDALVDFLGGASIAGSELFLYVRDGSGSPAFYIYEILTSPYAWNGIEALSLNGFWPGPGSIASLEILGSRQSAVPEGTTIGLFALGLGALARHRRRSAMGSDSGPTV